MSAKECAKAEPDRIRRAHERVEKILQRTDPQHLHQDFREGHELIRRALERAPLPYDSLLRIEHLERALAAFDALLGQESK